MPRAVCHNPGPGSSAGLTAAWLCCPRAGSANPRCWQSLDPLQMSLPTSVTPARHLLRHWASVCCKRPKRETISTSECLIIANFLMVPGTSGVSCVHVTSALGSHLCTRSVGDLNELRARVWTDRQGRRAWTDREGGSGQTDRANQHLLANLPASLPDHQLLIHETGPALPHGRSFRGDHTGAVGGPQAVWPGLGVRTGPHTRPRDSLRGRLNTQV